MRAVRLGQCRRFRGFQTLRPSAPFLPADVLWRQKEQFSDGVGYSWIDGIKDHADRVISDNDMATTPSRFPHNTPATKEATYFRTIFHEHFPANCYGNGIERTIPGGPSVACSTAKAIEWDVSFQNVRSRVLKSWPGTG